MGRPPELEDDTLLGKVIGSVDAGDASVPEVHEGKKESAHVGRGVLIKEIDIASKAGMPVVDDASPPTMR